MDRIKISQQTVFEVGNKRYYSLLGASRHLARIKIMRRLADYFNEQGEIERARSGTQSYNSNLWEDRNCWERYYYPSKARYKLMRERLARTIRRAEKKKLWGIDG